MLTKIARPLLQYLVFTFVSRCSVPSSIPMVVMLLGSQQQPTSLCKSRSLPLRLPPSNATTAWSNSTSPSWFLVSQAAYHHGVTFYEIQLSSLRSVPSSTHHEPRCLVLENRHGQGQALERSHLFVRTRLILRQITNLSFKKEKIKMQALRRQSRSSNRKYRIRGSRGRMMVGGGDERDHVQIRRIIV